MHSNRIYRAKRSPAPPYREPLSWAEGQVRAYLGAIAITLLALFLTRRITPFFGNTFFELLHLSVVLSAFYAGTGPGMVSALISFLAIDYFWVPPINAFRLGPHFIRLLIFEAIAISIAWLATRLRRDKEEIQSSHDELEVRIKQRTEELSRANEELRREVEQRLEAERAILDISAREQHRLGQDLHDGLCQTLAGVRLLVENLADSSAALVKAALETIDRRLGEALTQANDSSRGLYPVELETNGLAAALEELATSTSALYGVDCQFRAWDDVEFNDSAAATHLYRIAQEAVVNAVKHGKAKRINIRLMKQPGRTVLRVIDNGIGFSKASKGNGMGLKISAYRARVINGALRYRSGRNGGTAVSCAVPLQ